MPDKYFNLNSSSGIGFSDGPPNPSTIGFACWLINYDRVDGSGRLAGKLEIYDEGPPQVYIGWTIDVVARSLAVSYTIVDTEDGLDVDNTTAIIPLTGPVHVAVKLATDEFTVWINGAQAYTSAISAGTLSNTGALAIGSSFNAGMDDVRLYSDMTLGLAQTLYANGFGTKDVGTALFNINADANNYRDLVSSKESGAHTGVTIVDGGVPFKFTFTYSAGAGGSITGDSPQIVDRGGSGTQVTAVASEGYTFEKWSDNVLTAARTDSSAAADVTVSASFTLNTYTVTPSVDGTGGTISPDTPETVNHGDDSTIYTATPADNFEIDTWLVNDVDQETSAETFQVVNVTENTTVKVRFSAVAPPAPSRTSFDLEGWDG